MRNILFLRITLSLVILLSFYSCNKERTSPSDQKQFFTLLENYNKGYEKVSSTNNSIKIIDFNNKMRNHITSYDSKTIKGWIGKVSSINNSGFGNVAYVDYSNFRMCLMDDLFAHADDVNNKRIVETFSKLNNGDWVIFDGKISIGEHTLKNPDSYPKTENLFRTNLLIFIDVSNVNLLK